MARDVRHLPRQVPDEDENPGGRVPAMRLPGSEDMRWNTKDQERTQGSAIPRRVLEEGPDDPGAARPETLEPYGSIRGGSAGSPARETASRAPAVHEFGGSGTVAFEPGGSPSLDPVAKDPPTRPKARSGGSILPLLILILEVLAYPFYLIFMTDVTLEALAEDKTEQAGILLGLALAGAIIGALMLRVIFSRTDYGQRTVRFLIRRKVRPGEVPGFIGIIVPLLVIGLWIAIFFIFVAVQLFFISIPIYIYYKWRKGKGLRVLLRWWLKKLGRIAVRLKRMNYLGYLLPIIGSSMISNWIAGKESQATPQSTYVVILIQLVFLLALIGPFRKATRADEGAVIGGEGFSEAASKGSP